MCFFKFDFNKDSILIERVLITNLINLQVSVNATLHLPFIYQKKYILDAQKVTNNLLARGRAAIDFINHMGVRFN